MDNHEIAAVFRRLADLMELGEENPFKIRAYRAAADTIEDTTTPLAEMIEAGGVARLRELPGVGEAISKRSLTCSRPARSRLTKKSKPGFPKPRSICSRSKASG